MFRFNHFNFNVLDLEKSMDFYKKALGLTEASRIEREDFTIVYLTDGATPFKLELTWLHDRKERSALGECEFHVAFTVKDFDAAHQRHSEMGCICYENPDMGIYIIEDPDGYWLEVVPEK